MRKKTCCLAVLIAVSLLFISSTGVLAASGKSQPAAPILSPAPTSITKGNVTVTVYYPGYAGVKQYRLGPAGLWQNYTGPFAVTSNMYVYAQYKDNKGRWSQIAGYNITNIDKTPPDMPTFELSGTAPTGQPVTVHIKYSGDSDIKQYRIGESGKWTSYKSPIVLSSNNIVYARASDAAGNWTSITFHNVSSDTAMKRVLGYTVNFGAYEVMTANTGTLTDIATATWGIDGLGNLSGGAPADQIEFANSSGMKTNLVVSNSFNSTIARTLLESAANRANLVNNILNTLKTYNYTGVNIDIENIPAADRPYFTAFMSEVYNKLKPLGYEVSVAVQAKTSDSPAATWNYAFDYKSLANYSDYLMIMAYDEHYPGGTPGPVASMEWVTSVVNYGLTVVPREKIVLGLAAYGYDWSINGTRAYSINNCYNLANTYGAPVLFDSTAKSKYFSYKDSFGTSHTVWFEDADTISYKLDLVNSKDLKGIGIWRLGLDNPDYWNMIRSKLAGNYKF